MTMQTHVLSWLLGTLLLQLSSAWDSDIRIPPSITTGPPKYRLFKEKENIQIPCEATGTATIEYYWYKDDVLIDLNNDRIHWDPTQPGGAIIIENTKEEDEGYYQCQAESTNGKSVSDMLFLQVAVFETTSGDVTRIYHSDVGTSETIYIEGRESVPAPTFQWVTVREDDSDSADVISNTRVNTDALGNLYFSYVKTEDQTQADYIYRCDINNPYLDLTVGTSYSTLTVIANGDNADVAPEIMYRTGDGNPVVGLLGQELKIGCFFSGKGDVDIRWSRSSSNNLAPHHKEENYKTELWIDPVILTDEDTFTCTGTNSQGSGTGVITVIVEAQPEFDDAEHRGPKPQNASNGDTVVFYCNAMAIPPATVTWYLNGQPFVDPSSDNRFRISDDGTMLNIFDVCKKCDDPIHNSDLMNIQCNASNIHGYAYSEGYVNVLVRTVIAEGDGPVATELEYGEGKNAILLCKASSDDSTKIEYSWLLQEEEVWYVDDEIWMTEDHSLKIQAKDEETAEKYVGTFTCVASNGYSEARASAVVSLEGYPKPTSCPPVKTWTVVLTIIGVILIVMMIITIFTVIWNSRQRQNRSAQTIHVERAEFSVDREKVATEVQAQTTTAIYETIQTPPDSVANADADDGNNQRDILTHSYDMPLPHYANQHMEKPTYTALHSEIQNERSRNSQELEYGNMDDADV